MIELNMANQNIKKVKVILIPFYRVSKNLNLIDSFFSIFIFSSEVSSQVVKKSENELNIDLIMSKQITSSGQSGCFSMNCVISSFVSGTY